MLCQPKGRHIRLQIPAFRLDASACSVSVAAMMSSLFRRLHEFSTPLMSLRLTAFPYTLAQVRKFVRESFASIGGLASTLIGNAGIFLLIASAVDPSEFGRFAKSYASVSLVMLLVDFGYQQRILRDLDRYVDRFGGLPTTILHVKLLLALVAIGIVAPLVVLLSIDPAIVAVVGVGLLALSFGHVAGTSLRAQGLHAKDSLNMFMSSLLGMIYAAVLWWTGMDNALPFAFAFTITGLLYSILSYALLRRYLRWRHVTPTVAKIRKELSAGVSYASDTIVVRSYGAVDVIILSAFAGTSAVGIYQVGQKLMQMILPFGQVLTNVLLPLLSRKFYREGVSDAPLAQLLGLLAITSIVAYAGFYTVGYLIVTYALDPAYGFVLELLPIFGITVAFRILAVGPSLWLVAAGVQKIRLIGNIATLVLFVVLLAILTPALGAYGAAMASALAGVGVLIFYLIGTRFAHLASGTVLPRKAKTDTDEEQSS